MYALVDCNSFFCAVERVFHPGLRGKPVCVLSNNDGCIVALTPDERVARQLAIVWGVLPAVAGFLKNHLQQQEATSCSTKY